MEFIARFEKVSEEQFLKDIERHYSNDKFLKSLAEEEYSAIKLPKRATSRSAGYDFFSPFTFTLAPSEDILITTGIRVCIDEDWSLDCYPRSGLGCKYGIQLCNTVGIIDSDYYYSDNEGHIMLKIKNTGDKEITIAQGEAFAQGKFCKYGITVDDDAIGIRNGGFGSTGK